jgi:hypothetical protein
MSDASFEDGAERPLRLMAADRDDLNVISSLAQDAVLTVADISWQPKRRLAAFLINRFRWEDARRAQQQGRRFERVRAVLQIEDASAMQANGIAPNDKEMVLSLLSVGFEGDETGGRILLSFAGDGDIALRVDAINVSLIDVTRPYGAPSGKAPKHSI